MSLLPDFARHNIEGNPELIKALDNLGWLFFDKVLRMGGGLLIGFWLARHLGPAQYGLMSYSVAFVGVFSAVTGLGLNGIVVRNIVREPKSACETIVCAFVMQAIAGLLIVPIVFLAIMAAKPGNDLIINIVTIISLGLIFKSTDAFKCWFEARLRSRYVVWVEGLVFLAASVARVCLILVNSELMAFVWLILIEYIFIAFGFFAIVTLNFSRSEQCGFNLARAKSILGDGLPLLLSAIAVTLYMRLDVIMLEEMSSSREVGIYSAAVSLSEGWYFLPAIIISSVSPYIISHHATSHEKYIKALMRLYFTMTWLAVAVSIPAAIFSDSVVSLFFGPEYLGAGDVLKIHLWASVPVFLGMASSQYLLAESLQIISLYRTCIGLVVNIGLNVILIPEMGSKGAAIATLISYIVATFSLVLFKPTRGHAQKLIVSAISFKEIRG